MPEPRLFDGLPSQTALRADHHVDEVVPRLRSELGERVAVFRKQAARRGRELRAAANRLTFGRPKAERKLVEAQREKASRELEALRLDTGEDR